MKDIEKKERNSTQLHPNLLLRLVFLILLITPRPTAKSTPPLTRILLTTQLAKLIPLRFVFLPGKLRRGCCDRGLAIRRAIGMPTTGMCRQRTDGVLASVNAECSAKGPVYGLLNRMVEDVGQEWDDR